MTGGVAQGEDEGEDPEFKPSTVINQASKQAINMGVTMENDKEEPE
jgi:hypothetical protein